MTTPAKKPAKKFNPKTWSFAASHKIVQESARIFRTYIGRKRGGTITFSSKAGAIEFALHLNHRTSGLFGGKGSLPWWIDLESSVQDPIFFEGRLPSRLNVGGKVALYRPTFHSSPSGCRVSVDSYRYLLHLNDVTFKGGTCGLSGCTSLRTHSGLILDGATVYLADGVSIDRALFKDLTIYLAPDAELKNAYVREDTFPLFFQGVGSEQGTLSVYVDREGHIRVARGCFAGTPEEFLAAVAEKRASDRWRTHYPKLMALAKSHLSAAAKIVAEELKQEIEDSGL